MHHKYSVSRPLCWSVLLALLLGTVLTGRVQAQEAAKGKSLIVPFNGTATLESKTILKDVKVEIATILRASIAENNPRAVLLTGLRPGATRLTLIDVMNKSE